MKSVLYFALEALTFWAFCAVLMIYYVVLA